MIKFKVENLICRKQNPKIRLVWILFLSLGFLSCKRSIFHQQAEREYDPKLVRVLNKLANLHADRKVRVNTWDTQTDTYQDLDILDDDNHKIQTLTIGDSIKFVGLDMSQPDGIRAKVETDNHLTGFIPYSKIEEFEPAARLDPDLESK